MSSNGPGAFVYIVPAVALAALLVYFLYVAVDRLGLDTRKAEARVTGKQVAAGSTVYNTNVVAGRPSVQPTKNPDACIVTLDVNGEAAGGVVTPQLYESLRPGDVVRVEFQRTRLSGRILVTDVRR